MQTMTEKDDNKPNEQQSSPHCVDLDENNEDNVEEYDVLDSKLDDLNTALDMLEQKNDDIHKRLKELLQSNRDIREQLRHENSEAGQNKLTNG